MKKKKKRKKKKNQWMIRDTTKGWIGKTNKQNKQTSKQTNKQEICTQISQTLTEKQVRDCWYDDGKWRGKRIQWYGMIW